MTLEWYIGRMMLAVVMKIPGEVGRSGEGRFVPVRGEKEIRYYGKVELFVFQVSSVLFVTWTYW